MTIQYKPAYDELHRLIQEGGPVAYQAAKETRENRSLMEPDISMIERDTNNEDFNKSLDSRLYESFKQVLEDNKEMLSQLKDMDVDYGEESIPNRPAGAKYFTDPDLKNFSNTIKNLKENKMFSSKLSELAAKYNIPEREILMVGAKESSLMTNPRAKNMFQILETPAKEAGINLSKLNTSKNPVDQLNALEKYLDRWNYADFKGSVPLGLLIAAPSARNKDKNFVVYKKGSKELKANPKWAEEGKDATVESITKFYRGDA